MLTRPCGGDSAGCAWLLRREKPLQRRSRGFHPEGPYENRGIGCLLIMEIGIVRACRGAKLLIPFSGICGIRIAYNEDVNGVRYPGTDWEFARGRQEFWSAGR